MNMKRLATFAALSVLGLMVPHANAQRLCNNAELVGGYSFVASGTFGTNGFAAAGQGFYDGNGGVTGVINMSVGGTVTGPITWTGTYVVNPDCTATKTVVIPGIGTVHFFITAGNGFAELRFIATDTGTVISGTAQRQY